MTLTTFQEEIEQAVKKPVKLKINDNRSTMLSVKWEPGYTKVSMHRMFLEAPKNIMDALSVHIKTKNSNVCPSVKAYIEEKLPVYDYSKSIDKSRFVTKGETYDLKELYDSINQNYFDGQIDLHITWYGKVKSKRRSQVTFGLYQQSLQLVKIHRMMDSSLFPEYFVRFVIYHEMLHHICPAYYDQNGRHHIHTPEFKRREREFREYDEAQNWMKNNTNHFFI